MNYKNFLSNNDNIDKKKLMDELKKYKKENEEMKNKNNLLTSENMKLKNDLSNANEIISNFNRNNQQNNNVNMVNINDIIVIQFISTEQKINCAIKTLKTDTFAEVEEKLYQKYPEYRETNNNFIFNGKIILRFKTVFENNIQDGDKIQLLNDV